MGWERAVAVVAVAAVLAVTAGSIAVLAVEAPEAAFTHRPDSVTEGDAITFDGTASVDGDAPILVYRWDFDDDGHYEAAGREARYVYWEPGEYSVRLKVVDASGQADAVDRVVRVQRNHPPDPAFVVRPADPVAGVETTFDAGPSMDPDGVVSGFRWDLDGDGGFERRGRVVSYEFADPGRRVVRLSVDDDRGDRVTLHRAVVVLRNRPPVAAFVVEPRPASVGNAVTVDASPSRDPEGEVAAYEWDFDGDGRYEAGGEVATRVFRDPGRYAVGLRVVDAEGQADAVERTVVVEPSLLGRVAGLFPSPGTLTGFQLVVGVTGFVVGVVGFAVTLRQYFAD